MTRRIPLHALALLGLATTALGLSGCPGDLANPEQYPSVPPCRGGLDVPQLFAARCGSPACHGAGIAPQADLDLVSDGLASRLVGVESTQCDGLLRVDPADPDQSFLLGKLLGPPAGCGDRMPIVGHLSPAEIACVRSWLHQVASTPVPDGGPRDSGGGDAAPTDASMDAPPPMDAATDGAPTDADVGDASGGDAATDGSTMDATSGDAAIEDAATDALPATDASMLTDAAMDDAGSTPGMGMMP